MPVQTTKTANIYFPDGAKVSVKESGGGSYVDVGAISTAVTATLNYDINQVETANAGKLERQIRNMTVAGAFTLINLEQASIERMGGGMFEIVTTTTTPTTTVSDQTIAADWTDKQAYDLVLLDSGVSLRTGAEPTITSVTASVTGVLAADDDYTILPDPGSVSGYSIIFNTAGTATVATTESIVIDYNSVTPIANSKLYAGASTVTLAAYAMKVTHTDDDSKVRELELFAVNGDSGGFQFNFKGANEDGVEEMPLTFTADLDTSLTSGRQLMSWSVDT